MTTDRAIQIIREAGTIGKALSAIGAACEDLACHADAMKLPATGTAYRDIGMRLDAMAGEYKDLDCLIPALFTRTCRRCGKKAEKLYAVSRNSGAGLCSECWELLKATQAVST